MVSVSVGRTVEKFVEEQKEGKRELSLMGK
jgi:hypothetical protein